MPIDAFSHGTLEPLNGNIHISYEWTYADAAAREAATGFVVTDQGKFARQLDDNTLWMLLDDSPIDWFQVTGAGSSGTLTTEEVQDIVGGMGENGTGTTFAYNDGTGKFKFDIDVTNADLLEAIRDAIGLALVEGSGIDITINDAGDTITLAVTGTATPTSHDHTTAGGDGGVLTNDEHDGFIEMVEISAPANPAANKLRIYPKDDAGTTKLYFRDSSGTETEVGSGGSVPAASDTVAGKVELATTAETATGTDATRAVTPDGLHDMTTLAGAAWFLDEDNMASDSAVKTASQQSIKAYVDTSIAGVGGGATNLDGLSDVVITSFQDGQILRRQSGTVVNIYRYYPINFVIDGGGTEISPGIKGDIRIHVPGVIVGGTLLADQSGSIVIDLWKDTRANFPPVDGDSITASAPLTLSSATNSEDTTLTGWTTTVADGDIIRLNVDSVTTLTRVTVVLKIRES